jgi:hypothetical protein
MATLRLIKPSEAVPADDVRIKLESLPAPLRARIRERSESAITMEAELPWLAVGTAMHAGTSDGIEHAGHVQSFDVEVTSSGTARLLIFADLTAAGAPIAAPPPAAGPRVVRSWRRPILAAAALLAAASAGFLLGQLSGHRAAPALPRVVEPVTAEPSPKPKAPAEVAPVVPTPAAPVAAAAEAPPPSPPAAGPRRHKKLKHATVRKQSRKR